MTPATPALCTSGVREVVFTGIDSAGIQDKDAGLLKEATPRDNCYSFLSVSKLSRRFELRKIIEKTHVIRVLSVICTVKQSYNGIC